MSRPEPRATVSVAASTVELAVTDRDLVLLQARRALARGRRLLAADHAVSADLWEAPLPVALRVLTTHTDPGELVTKAADYGLCVLPASTSVPAPR